MKVQCQGMKSQLSHSCPGTAQHTAAPEAWEGSQGHRHSHLPVPSVPPKYHSHRGIHLGKHGQCDRLTPTHSPCEGQAEGLIAGWGSRSQGGSLAGELREEPVSTAARESCPSRQWPPHSVREGKACSTTAPSALPPSLREKEKTTALSDSSECSINEAMLINQRDGMR